MGGRFACKNGNRNAMMAMKGETECFKCYSTLFRVIEGE